jgi:serine/threonine protein kinase
LCTSGSNKGIPFALKVFRVISREERKDKFLAEREFLENDCKHPSIMRVFDSGVFTNENGEEFPFVVTEYLPQTLSDIIRGQRSTVVEKISYTLQLLSALAYLDNLADPVVHRDIKPQNIFLKGQSCVLGDFGLMKLLDGQDEIDREIFKESVGPGMPYYYRTPDLIAYANNESEITTKSDVFQLGLVIAELFTGRNPAIAPPNDDLLAPLVLEGLKWVPGTLGGSVATLIRRMLIVDPTERESAEHLIDPWQGVFEEAINLAHDLEGKAF